LLNKILTAKLQLLNVLVTLFHLFIYANVAAILIKLSCGLQFKRNFHHRKNKIDELNIKTLASEFRVPVPGVTRA